MSSADWTIVVMVGAVCLFVGMYIGVVVERAWQKSTEASE